MNPEQTLRFTKIYLKNWRNFSEAEIVLPRRSFLVGPNATGKTNFLDALRFLSEIATPGSGGLVGAVNRREGFANIRSRSVKGDAQITVRATIGDDRVANIWEYEITFEQRDQAYVSTTDELIKWRDAEVLHRWIVDTEEDGKKVKYLHGTGVLLDDRGYNFPVSPGPTRYSRPLTQTYLEQEGWLNPITVVNGNEITILELANFFNSIRHFNVVPELVRHPDWRGNAENGYNNFIEQIVNTPKPEQIRKLKLIQEVLRGAVPQFKDLDVALGTFDVPHLYANYANWRGKNTRENEASFSDGTLRLIGLLWSVMDGDGPLLVEEPEISLHYGIVRFIPQMLERLGYSSGRQVIVSTHSTDMLVDEGIRADEVLLFTPEKRGTTITPASSISEMKTLAEGGFNLGMIVQSSTAPVDGDSIAYFDPISQEASE